MEEIKIMLSVDERIICLRDIASKLKKVLYVYEKSLEPDSKYNYKVYCGGIMLYVSSSNYLFNGELVSILVNLTSVLNNDLSKKEIKRLVLESANYAQYLLDKYTKQKEEEDNGHN